MSLNAPVQTQDMPETQTDHGVFHVTRDAAALAGRLVASGSPEDLARAERIYDALLSCQEARPDHPHVGNFLWMAEDSEVEDLNAVEFVLSRLIYTLRADGAAVKKYSPDLFDRLVKSVRAGLSEIARLDVHPGYTNIAVLDSTNTCLGAELVGDEALFARGFRKLCLWCGFTVRSGHVMEFNSPTYLPVSIDALTRLATDVQHPTVRALAAAAARRLLLSAGLRYHPASGRWAGPHGRGYAASIGLEQGHREEKIARSRRDGDLRFLARITDSWNRPVEITETASVDQGLQLTSLLSDSFCVGTALKPFMSQSNVLIAYIADPANPGQTRNVMYSRYLTNDKWFGDFYHDTDRSNTRNLLDEGRFIGLQRGNTILAAYAPDSLESVSAAAAELVLASADAVDRVQVDGALVEDFPVSVERSRVIGIETGGTCIAIRCAELVPLGADSGIRIVRRGDSLVVEFLQYRGQKKSFWETRTMGGFYKGKAAVGFVLSVAELSECGSLDRHVSRLASARVTSEAQPPGMYDGASAREWCMTYEDAGDEASTLSMTVDLYAWKLLSSVVGGEAPGQPMLNVVAGDERQPVCAESNQGSVTLDSLTAHWTGGAVWLARSHDGSAWACGWINPEAKPGTLKVQAGEDVYELSGTVAGFLHVQHSLVHADVEQLERLTVPDRCEVRPLSLNADD